MMGYNFGAMNVWMWVLMVVFWVCVVGGAAWVLSLVISRKTDGQPPRATDALEMRYARGELTKDQYDAMRRDLAAH